MCAYIKVKTIRGHILHSNPKRDYRELIHNSEWEQQYETKRDKKPKQRTNCATTEININYVSNLNRLFSFLKMCFVFYMKTYSRPCCKSWSHLTHVYIYCLNDTNGHCKISLTIIKTKFLWQQISLALNKIMLIMQFLSSHIYISVYESLMFIYVRRYAYIYIHPSISIYLHRRNFFFLVVWTFDANTIMEFYWKFSMHKTRIVVRTISSMKLMFIFDAIVFTYLTRKCQECDCSLP